MDEKYISIPTKNDMKVLQWLNKATGEFPRSAINFDASMGQAMARDSHRFHAANIDLLDGNSPLDGLHLIKKRQESVVATQLDSFYYWSDCIHQMNEIDKTPPSLEILVDASQMQDAFSGFRRYDENHVRLVFSGAEDPLIEMYGYSDSGAALYVLIMPIFRYNSGRTWRPK